MSDVTTTELAARLAEAEDRIAELETARLRAETLFAVTQVLGKTLSLQDTFDTILDQLHKVVPYDSSSVQVIRDQRLVIVHGRGFDELDSLLGVGFDLEDETNPSIQVLRSKRELVVGDVSHHPHFASQLHGGGRIRGWICAPLIFADRVIGVITLDKLEPDFYNEDLAKLATAFAAHAATAIEHARLFETERAAREQADTLRAAAQSLGSTLSLRQVFGLILSELRKVVPYDSCSVQQLEEDEMVIVGGYGFPNLDELLGQRFKWSDADDPAGEVVDRRQPVIIANVSARFEHFKDETHGEGRVKGWMGVPLLTGDRLLGMITLDKLDEGFYTPEHARTAQAFASFAVSAIENARLFETERAAREQAETLRATAQSLASTLSLAEVFELVLSELRKVVPYDSCSVQQLEGDEMVIVGGYGFPNLDELVGQRFNWSDADDPAGEVVQGREPVIIPDASARFAHFAKEIHGGGSVKGWMGVPLLTGDGLIGMITLDKHEARFYTAEHAQMAKAFAAFAATAIEKARLFDEIQSLLAEAKDARAAADAANAAKGTFLAAMSHEIRTPMNAVLGMSELLIRSELDAEQRDSVSTILRSGEALLAIIDDILDFSKIEAGRMELDAAPFALRDCIDGAVGLIGSLARRKGIALSAVFGPNVPDVVLGDASRLQQILLNVLNNAVKFTEQGEVIASVSASGPDDAGLLEIRVTVRDTGIGIPADRIGRLFQPFTQTDPSITRRFGGTGLGLAISKRLAEAMGGTMWAESDGTGRGSSFHITIKVQAAAAGAAAVTARDPQRAPADLDPELAGRHPLRILLVEDNPINQKLALRLLSRMGYEADVAVNGVEAVDAVEQRSYDLVLMDVQMPEMDGLEATRTIVERVEVARMPRIVAMTANAMAGDRESCFAAGMHGYLAKPIRVEELVDALLTARPTGP
jgi:signal transduction histidine kinase/CheY-like chemotaxis protein